MWLKIIIELQHKDQHVPTCCTYEQTNQMCCSKCVKRAAEVECLDPDQWLQAAPAETRRIRRANALKFISRGRCDLVILAPPHSHRVTLSAHHTHCGTPVNFKVFDFLRTFTRTTFFPEFGFNTSRQQSGEKRIRHRNISLAVCPSL